MLIQDIVEASVARRDVTDETFATVIVVRGDPWEVAAVKRVY